MNGIVVQKIPSSPYITIEFDGEPVLSLPIVIVWHKPLDVVSTLRDPLGRRDYRQCSSIGATLIRWVVSTKRRQAPLFDLDS